MKVKFLKEHSEGDRTFEEGETANIAEKGAKNLINHGVAKDVNGNYVPEETKKIKFLKDSSYHDYEKGMWLNTQPRGPKILFEWKGPNP